MIWRGKGKQWGERSKWGEGWKSKAEEWGGEGGEVPNTKDVKKLYFIL